MNGQVDKFHVVVNRPSAGWIRVEVRFGGQEHSLSVSYLSDAIGDFVQAVAGLTSRQCKWGGQSTADWQDEPGAWRWWLTPSDGSVRVRVDRYPDCFPRPGAVGSPVFDVAIPGRRFGNAVLRAMDTVTQSMSGEQFEASWRHPFPTESVERLRAAVQAWKQGDSGKEP